MLKHVRMLMGQCRRAGWHSEDPRHKQGSQDDQQSGYKKWGRSQKGGEEPLYAGPPAPSSVTAGQHCGCMCQENST